MSKTPDNKEALGSRWHRRAAERPEELFQATLATFLEKGYRATRLDDIARAAGVTKPLVYHYFRDKDDLLLQAMRWRMDQFLQEMRLESGSAADGFETRLRRLFDRSWERWRRPEWGRFHGAILSELRQDAPELFRRWVEISLVERWRLFESVLRDGQLRGEVRADLDCPEASRFLVSGGVHMAWLHLHAGCGQLAACDDARLRETALEIFLLGVRATGQKKENA